MAEGAGKVHAQELARGQPPSEEFLEQEATGVARMHELVCAWRVMVG